MWTGLNIRFNTPSEVDRFILEELKRLFDKDSIHSKDGSLMHLAEVILERENEKEIEDLGTIYVKFSMAFKTRGCQEENIWKQSAILDQAISFYDIGRGYNSALPLDYKMSVIKFLHGTNQSNQDLMSIAVQELCTCIESNPSNSKIKQLDLVIKDLRKQGIEDIQFKSKIDTVLNKVASEELNPEIMKIRTLLDA